MKKTIQAYKDREAKDTWLHLKTIENIKNRIDNAKANLLVGHGDPYKTFYENEVRNLEYLLKELEGKPC